MFTRGGDGHCGLHVEFMKAGTWGMGQMGQSSEESVYYPPPRGGLQLTIVHLFVVAQFPLDPDA